MVHVTVLPGESMVKVSSTWWFVTMQCILGLQVAKDIAFFQIHP